MCCLQLRVVQGSLPGGAQTCSRAADALLSSAVFTLMVQLVLLEPSVICHAKWLFPSIASCLGPSVRHAALSDPLPSLYMQSIETFRVASMQVLVLLFALGVLVTGQIYRFRIAVVGLLVAAGVFYADASNTFYYCAPLSRECPLPYARRPLHITHASTAFACKL